MKRAAAMLAGIAFLGAAVAAVGEGMDAESLVRRQLREKGLRIGYDTENRRMVQVATVVKEISPETTNSADFGKRRAVAVCCAGEMARSAVMRSISHMVEVRGRTEAFAGGGETETGVSADSAVRSSFVPYGCEAVAVEETLEDGVLETCVAVSWSPAAEKAARAALFARPDEFPEETGPVGAFSPEWEQWAAAQDFRKTLGFRSFRGSDGIWRFAGVGTVDIEGKSEVAKTAARRQACELARAQLAYALMGSEETFREMHQWLGEHEGEKDSASVLETMVSERMAKSAKVTLPSGEVYTTTVVDPLTERELWVSVVGIEPRALAELRRGGSGGGVPAGRPEHGARPVPNRPEHGGQAGVGRPDHSPRPAVARPEHPVWGAGWSQTW